MVTKKVSKKTSKKKVSKKKGSRRRTSKKLGIVGTYGGGPGVHQEQPDGPQLTKMKPLTERPG